MTFALAMLAFWNFVAQVPSIDSETPPALVNTDNEVRFRLSSGYLISLEGRIGASPKLRFLLDTGATVTLVDQRVADSVQARFDEAE